jgi:hypothetical protein
VPTLTSNISRVKRLIESLGNSSLLSIMLLRDPCGFELTFPCGEMGTEGFAYLVPRVEWIMLEAFKPGYSGTIEGEHKEFTLHQPSYSRVWWYSWAVSITLTYSSGYFLPSYDSNYGGFSNALGLFPGRQRCLFFFPLSDGRLCCFCAHYIQEEKSFLLHQILFFCFTLWCLVCEGRLGGFSWLIRCN